MSSSRKLDAVILAGGEGKRMKAPVPKVLLDLMGRPVIGHVIDAVRSLNPRRIVIVGGKNLPLLKRALSDEDDLTFVKQVNPQGTAHAVRFALNALPKTGGEVMILNGDGPLVRGASLRRTLGDHRKGGYLVTVISAMLEDGDALGRIVRDPKGRFERIVEAKDATLEELEIREINAGQYVVGMAALRRLLPRIKNKNRQKEYYLTDLIGLAGQKVCASVLEDAQEALGINTYKDYLEVLHILKLRIMEEHVARGVQIVDPFLTYLESGVYVEPGTIIHPFSVIRRGVSIRARCSVGPMAHLRAGTELEEDVCVGDFVEIKASHLGQGSKALHLAYLGDARIGKGVNVGAGTITANFDGRKKHQTTVDDDVSLGAGTVLVAPVHVGKGARTGAGAVVTAGDDVNAGATVAGVPAKPLRKPRKKRTRS